MGSGGSHTHVRSCIGCGKKAQKSELLRIVRTEQGMVYDPTGRKPGRGAYVCSMACLEKASQGKKLERALKSGVSQKDLEILGREIAQAASMVE